MHPVTAHLRLRGHLSKHRVVLECTEEFVVAGARFVLPGDECIDDLQSCASTHAQRGGCAANANAVVTGGRVFQRSNDSRSDGNDASAPVARCLDRIRRLRGDFIRLCEREHRVETRIAGR